jgi:hypothetical protein
MLRSAQSGKDLSSEVPPGAINFSAIYNVAPVGKGHGRIERDILHRFTALDNAAREALTA